ncbi:MAG: single-stranded DNA-binding protein [Candidatus Limnocylindria bacterium]
MAFSKVMFIGNLGRDPEMRYTPNGRAVTEFSVAVTHRGRDQQTGEWSDLGTDWFRVSIWGDRAERAAEEFRKGMRVLVEGRFRTREYEAKDGQKRISLDVTADNVIAMDRKGRDDEGGGSFAAPQGGFSGGQAGPGGQAGSGGGGGGAVRPTRPADDDNFDDLPF